MKEEIDFNKKSQLEQYCINNQNSVHLYVLRFGVYPDVRMGACCWFFYHGDTEITEYRGENEK